MFEVSWLYFGTDTIQPSKRFMVLVTSVRYACKYQKMAALRIKSFLCNHSINAVLTGFNRDTFNKNKRCHMTLEGLSSVCTKLESASSKNNKIYEINVLQKFTSHAL